MSEFVLKADAISKSFATPHARVQVLEKVSLALSPSQSQSIMGASGSGKTTLINLLSALEAPDTGEVFWNGQKVDFGRLVKLPAVRGRFVGLVFQTYQLFPELNAIENVLIAKRVSGRIKKADEERAAELLKQVGLGERVRQSPHKLSGGERQRVALVRALINSPQMILADEPTGNLDEKTGAEVMDVLFELCEHQNVALLLVTHNQGFADRANQCWSLAEGVLHAR